MTRNNNNSIQNNDEHLKVIGIYECIDSSIFLEELNEERRFLIDFADYCDHRTRCHDLAIRSLNKQFLNYLIEMHSLRPEIFVSNFIRFCCSLNHSNLKRIIQNNQRELGIFILIKSGKITF